MLGLMTALYSLHPDAVGIAAAADKQQVLSVLAGRFAAVYGLDAVQVQDMLEERERLGSTGFGRGVAIPHARINGLSRPVCAVLRLDAPVAFDAADALPVELVFGLLSPAQSGAVHLQALAAISRTMRDDRVREQLIDSSDPEAIYALLANVADRDAA